MLHAAALEFPHPAGGSKRLEAATPADMQAVAEAVGMVMISV